MYENITNYIHAIKSKITTKRLILGVVSVVLVVCVCRFADDYLTTRANYQRTFEQLERTQRALDESRNINQQLQTIIDRGRRLNDEAGRGIDRLEDYQREEGTRIDNLESYQRATGARISDSIQSLDDARGEIERSRELIERIEIGNQTK